jgi:diguanylate cyclase (GGDEF)-like protein
MRSISKALESSEQATELVKESAEDLASVNTVLKQQMKGRAGVTEALEKNVEIEEKVAQATDKLSDVNHALEGEMRDRILVDEQLATLTEQEEAARHAAFHDVLTGLPNRALFNDRLEHSLAQAKRHGWSLAVMFFDLDKFKSINDTHGHDVGDAVLLEVARRLKENTREDDTVCRHGGDEFLYLLVEVPDGNTIALIARKIIDAIQAPLAINLGGLALSLRIKTSIGISIYPKHGASVDSLVKSADLAMYEAKKHAVGYAFAR